MNGRIEISVVTCKAPAKINLYLHVIGERPDGYYNLDSLVAFAGLGDILSARKSDSLSLEITGPFSSTLLQTLNQNIVLSAARALADAASIPAVAKISLVKNLPIAAGLGGGSADAAAVLRILKILWNLDSLDLDLQSIAISLGADVPGCLASKPSFIGGIGDRVIQSPILPRVGLLLVNPLLPLSTSTIFNSFTQRPSFEARFSKEPLDAVELSNILENRQNDLTTDAGRLCPQIFAILERLNSLPGCHLARMTGSGATCFGIFDHFQAAQHAASALDQERWWVMPTVLSTKFPISIR